MLDVVGPARHQPHLRVLDIREEKWLCYIWARNSSKEGYEGSRFCIGGSAHVVYENFSLYLMGHQSYHSKKSSLNLFIFHYHYIQHFVDFRIWLVRASLSGAFLCFLSLVLVSGNLIFGSLRCCTSVLYLSMHKVSASFYLRSNKWPQFDLYHFKPLIRSETFLNLILLCL